MFATVLSEKEGKLQCAPLQGKLISSVALIYSQQHTVQEGGRVKVVSFFFKKKDREIRSKTIKKKKTTRSKRRKYRVERKLWRKFLVQFYKSRKTKIKSKFLDAEM